MSSPAEPASPAGPASPARPAGSASLEIREVSAGYGAVQVLRGVSITAQAGTITAVLGANGAGKTTLLRAIDGSVRPTRGQVWLDQENLTGRRPEEVSRAGVAHVPEGQGVITELTVAENLQLGLLLQPRGKRAAALAGLYDRFRILADRKSMAAGTLSGGERQMLVIARALATRPRVLLLDEPSLGLAPKIVRDVLDLISGLKEETGLTIILVEQNARSALAIADTGVVLNLGAVVATAPAGRLAADEALRRHYLGF
jgi:branched-chain amino acid transport system ATP-binding protein